MIIIDNIYDLWNQTSNNIWLLFFPEIDRIQGGGVPRVVKEDRKMADVTKEKAIKLTVRVLVPVRDHPKVMSWLCRKFFLFWILETFINTLKLFGSYWAKGKLA